MLKALVQYYQKTSKFFVPLGRIYGMLCGCKWGLLSVRKREIQRELGGVEVDSASKESKIFFFRCF
jgi:hypothetical protein